MRFYGDLINSEYRVRTRRPGPECWQPRLARTSRETVIQTSLYGSWKHRRAWADYIRRELPQFHWDSRRVMWRAPLSELPAAADVLRRKSEHVELSDGAAAYLKER